MAKRIRWDGRVLDLVEDATFEEMATVERGAKCGWGKLTNMESAAGMVMITLRRGGVILTWPEVLALKPSELSVDDADADGDGEDAEPDPTTPAT